MVVRTARITVETDTVMVIYNARTGPGWCPACSAEAEVIFLDNAAGLAEPAAAQIQEWLTTGQLHLWQPPDGPAQICLPSLLRCFEGYGNPEMRIAKEAT